MYISKSVSTPFINNAEAFLFFGNKIRTDIFFAGEIIDVDGDCGGYNLQWAWSSGRLAGKTIGERINNAQNQ